MKAKRLPESWEKQTVYRLKNEFKVTVEYSQHYGEMVSRIDAPKGVALPSGKTYWHCSDGHDAIPPCMVFAREWIEPIAPGHWDKIMRPGFEKE